MIVTPEKTLKVLTSLDCNKDLDDQLGPILHLLEDLNQHAHHPLQLLHGDLEERLLAEHLRGDEEVGQLLGVQLHRVHVETDQVHEGSQLVLPGDEMYPDFALIGY